MTEFFYLHTAHGRQLAADRTSGQVCSVEHAADHAQYPRLLAIVPSFRPDVLFLSAGDEAPFPISVQPHAFKSHLLPLFVERGQSDGTVALQFPGSVRYLCAGPGQPGTPGPVVANAEKRQAWENFSTVPVPAAAIAIPHHVTAQALDGLLDGTQISNALPRFLARAPSPAARHALQGAALLLDLEDLDRVAGALMQDPSRVAEFARHLPDDYWATVALPELQRWLAHRGKMPAGCDHVDLAAGQPAGMVDHQPHKLLLPESLDFLAKAGAFGSYASLGHACNAAARRLVKPSRTVCLIATARNEGLYLVEWIAYHRLAGVEAVYLYSNDNDDGSDALLSALADAGVITWIQSRVAIGGSAQYKAYGHALSVMPDILDYRWAIVIDLDEFFVFDPERFGSIRDFLAWHEIRPVDAIGVNWSGAACYGESVWRDSPVTRRFPVPKGSINSHIKSVFRPGMFIHSSPHFPRTDERRRPIFLSSLGTHYTYGKSAQKAGLPPYEWPAISDEPDVSLASINHYFFKSAEEFLWKASRNRGDLPKETGISQEQRLLPFFKAFVEKYGEQPAEVDDRVVRCAPALEEEMARLRAIPGVAEAEAGVRTAFQARMGEILAFYRDPPPLLADDATARIVALATRSEPVIASRDADCSSAEVRGAQSDGYSGLVIDLGVSEGNDTAYYLAKGFRVIGVEADAEACQRLRLRFKAEIESGAVKFLNFAASDTFGEPIDFFVHKDHQGVSATFKHPHLEAGYSQQRVMTIDWKTILAQAGVPRYLKIDIEMAEEAFLRGMMGYATPEFISVECHSLEPVELLRALGYERFKLVDQNPPGGFKLPAAQLEGRRIEWTAFNHASGPFGLDLFVDREWLDFAAFQEAWMASQEDYELGRRTYPTWFDCHAWKPN